MKFLIFVLGLILLSACAAAVFNQSVKKTKVVPKKVNLNISVIVFCLLLVAIIIWALPSYDYIGSTYLFNPR